MNQMKILIRKMNNKNGIGGFKLSVPFFIWQNKKDNNRKIDYFKKDVIDTS